MKIKGRVVAVLPENVDTDVIYPGRYLNVTNKLETPAHLFELVYPDLRSRILDGDLIVAGRNFGCGSSREQATTALKYAGIRAIIAPSFARIFYRNSLNQGLIPVVSQGVLAIVKEGDILEIDLEKGELFNVSNGKMVSASPLAPKAVELLKAGGLIPMLKKKYSSSGGGYV